MRSIEKLIEQLALLIPSPDSLSSCRRYLPDPAPWACIAAIHKSRFYKMQTRPLHSISEAALAVPIRPEQFFGRQIWIPSSKGIIGVCTA